MQQSMPMLTGPLNFHGLLRIKLEQFVRVSACTRCALAVDQTAVRSRFERVVCVAQKSLYRVVRLAFDAW